MPRFEITSPDGKRFEINAPEGATQEQALEYAQRQFAAPPQQAPAQAPVEHQQPSEADLIAGAPGVRFAMGAASPALGVAQLADEAMGGNVGVSAHLQRLEEMKRRGMTPAAELMRLKAGREQLSRLRGYEGAIAAIDRQIAEIEGAGASADPATAGADLAGLAGAVTGPAALGAMKLAAPATVMGRAAQGAGIGTAFGATAPVTDTDDYWTAKTGQIGGGAFFGGIIPPAMEAGRKLYQVGRRIIDPMLPGGVQRSASKLLNEAAGAQRPQIEAELAKNRVFVPGSQPTAAEAAAPAGSAEFSGLQRVMERRHPTEFDKIALAQQAARRGAVSAFGKDKAALTAAERARTTEANKLYGEAYEQVVKRDPELRALWKNPYFKDEVGEAWKIAQARGLSPRKNMTQFLHFVKEGLDARIQSLSKPNAPAISNAARGEILGAKGRLVAWLKAKNPSYDAARSAFAEASKPINTMKIGQELEEALTKQIGEGERATVFAGAVKDAPRTIKRAIGPRFDSLDEALDAGDYEAVKNVLADLSRQSEQQRLSRLGAAKANEITQAFSLPATGPLHQQYMIFKTVLGRVSRGVNDKVLDEVAEALKLPQSALKLLRMTPDAQRQQVIDGIISRKLGRGAIIGATTAASEGAQQ